MTGIPREALAAAAAACPFVNRDAIRRILEAATPHIAAAERERIAQMATLRGAVCARMPDRPLTVTTTGTVTVWEGGSLPSVIPFADLIRAEATP